MSSTTRTSPCTRQRWAGSAADTRCSTLKRWALVQPSESTSSWAASGYERDELEVYYQPLFSLQEDRIVGAEALVRWHHPERGFLSPAKLSARGGLPDSFCRSGGCARAGLRSGAFLAGVVRREARDRASTSLPVSSNRLTSPTRLSSYCANGSGPAPTLSSR